SETESIVATEIEISSTHRSTTELSVAANPGEPLARSVCRASPTRRLRSRRPTPHRLDADWLNRSIRACRSRDQIRKGSPCVLEGCDCPTVPSPAPKPLLELSDIVAPVTRSYHDVM